MISRLIPIGGASLLMKDMLAETFAT